MSINGPWQSSDDDKREQSVSRNGGGSRNHMQQQRRVVLSEEDYTSTLSSIVQRDYFPQIPQLERQQALLECRSRGDIAGAVAVRRATRKLMEHDQAMAAQRDDDDQDIVEIPRLLDSSGRSAPVVRKRPRPLQEETLTGFHARVTNEDDHEFDTNLKQEIQTNRQRLEKLFQQSKSVDISSFKRIQDGTSTVSSSKFMLDEMASDDFAPESNRISAVEWKNPTMKNELFFNPTPFRGSSIQSVQDPSAATIKLLTDGTVAVGDNKDSRLLSSSNLPMLPPSQSQTQRMISMRSNSSQTITDKLADKLQLVEYIPKSTLEKKIDPSQTRFPSTRSIIPFARPGLSTNAKTGLLDASDTDDTESYATDDAYYSTDLDAPLRPIEQERRRRAKRIDKQKEQESFVTMTPQIVPGVTPGSESPITTWGTIEQTPLVLSGRDPVELESMDCSSTSIDGRSSSSFLLPSQNRREEAARLAEMELARRAKRAKQQPTKVAKSTKSRSSARLGPTSSSRKMASLTPTLSQSGGGRLSSRSRDAFGSALRSSYSQLRTPNASVPSSKLESRQQSRRSVPRKRDHAYNATPQI